MLKAAMFCKEDCSPVIRVEKLIQIWNNSVKRVVLRFRNIKKIKATKSEGAFKSCAP